MSADEDTATGSGSGDMGVSSERVGETGPGQVGTTGTRDVGPETADTVPPPEQSADGEDVNPDAPIAPRSGYNSRDPRSQDHPYETDGPRTQA